VGVIAVGAGDEAAVAAAGVGAATAEGTDCVGTCDRAVGTGFAGEPPIYIAAPIRADSKTTTMIIIAIAKPPI
jgi:hypothetical protein